MIPRILNVQGIAGLAASLCLALLLLLQKGETRHWRRQSARFEQAYHSEQAAFATTVANYRSAAEAARSADRAASLRAAAEQRSINERTDHDYQARLADARARFARAPGSLHSAARRSPADPGGRGGSAVPGLSASSGRPAQGSGEDGLPPADALAATEQAIQLDELIQWVKRQAQVNPNVDGAPRRP